MKEGQPKTIRLVDYEAPGYVTRETDLTFDIKAGETRVYSSLKVERTKVGDSEIFLSGNQADLISVKLDGRVLLGNEYELSEEGLRISGLSDESIIEIETSICPEKNTSLEGLYKSSGMYCTQCEAEGFRNITFYQDRPDVLSKFTTTIIADNNQYPTLLSNGNLIAEEMLEGGRRKAVWEDPFPKPSYLFALVAGNLAVLEDEFLTMNGRLVELKIYSEPHNIDQCEFAMDALKRSMRWDEERFGREYDLDIFMIVAVEDFNMGAMENKGLNIFNTSCVLASPDTATDDGFQRVEAVVAHEYFHNWSGNRVTCRDWFQLSLKEGFTVFRDAEFTADTHSRSVKRIEDVGFLRSIQFAEDASPLAHPVMPDSYMEISNFYTTTIYEKGAEVVRMYQTLLGQETFRIATDAYFDRFDGKAATTDDFRETMAEIGGRDLVQFRRWYEQAGTPLLEISEAFEDNKLILRIEQSCEPTPGQEQKLPFHVPIVLGLIDETGYELDLSKTEVRCSMDTSLRDNNRSLLLELREQATEIEFASFDTKPVVSFLREFSAPVKLNYQREKEETQFIARNDKDGFVRWDAMQTLWLAAFDDPMLEEAPCEVVQETAIEALKAENAEQKLLRANMLSVPTELYLLEQLSDIDLDRTLNQRDGLLRKLAIDNQDTWLQLYETYESDKTFSAEADAVADRTLANLSFNYLIRGLLAEGKESDAVDLIDTRYRKSNNLTVRRNVLALVCHLRGIPKEFRAKILSDFYSKWRAYALVLDLWFNIQAQSPNYSIEEIIELESHSDFDVKNPNRARSIYGAFGMLNLRNFHHKNGSGYEFLGRAVEKLDSINPQIASRLCSPLTRWTKFDEGRSNLMRRELKRLSETKKISKDLYEIVSKSL